MPVFNQKLSMAILGVILFAGIATQTVVSKSNQTTGAAREVYVAESETQEEPDVSAVLMSVEIEPIEVNFVAADLKDIELVEEPEEEETEAETETEPETEVDEETAEEETVAEETAAEETTEAATPSYVISVSDEDYCNLLRIVEAEAGGSDTMTKMMVAGVIINRVRTWGFPDTITGVIFQGNGEQFTPIADGRFYSVTISSTTYDAVNRVLYGEDYSCGALYFSTVASANAGNWASRNRTRVAEYGGIVFFG